LKQSEDAKGRKREVEDLISFPEICMTDDGVILRKGSNVVLDHISVNAESKIRTRKDGVVFTVKECTSMRLPDGKDKRTTYYWLVNSEKKDISFICDRMTKIDNALMGYYGKQLTFILRNVSNVYEDKEEGEDEE
jgi:hypothetical protein